MPRIRTEIEPLFDPALPSQDVTPLTLEILRRVVSADSCWINSLNLRSARNRWAGPRNQRAAPKLKPPDSQMASDPCNGTDISQRPSLADLAQHQRMAPCRIGDFLSLYSSFKTPIYRHFYHGTRTSYQVSFAIEVRDGCGAVLNLKRSAADFRKRELLLLQGACTWIKKAWSLQAEKRRLSAELEFHVWADGQGSGLRTLGRALILLDLQGEVEWRSPRLHSLLGFFSDKMKPGVLLEQIFARYRREAAEFATRSGSDLFCKPLKSHQEVVSEGALVLRIVFCFDSRPAILLEISRIGNRTAHLSKRECEIVEWVRQGKLSPEIGCILGISHRTVEKHLQNIYAKLAVTSRTQLICAA